MQAVDRQTIEILRTIDSPTVCNVIELFKIRSQTEGFLHHSIQAVYPDLPPMVGHAVTCTFTSARPGPNAAAGNEMGRERESGGDAASTPAAGVAGSGTKESGGDAASTGGTTAYNDMAKQVEAILAVPPPRVFVFQDLDDDPVGASFGEMLASTYVAFGCVGIVTSGGARDVPAIRKYKLPLFARSRNVSHGYPQYPAMNVPVRVGGVIIRPGDLLHGDPDGVTTVPNELAPQIAAMCVKFLEAERRWVEYVAAPNPTAEGVGRVVAEQKRLVAEAMKEIVGEGMNSTR